MDFGCRVDKIQAPRPEGVLLYVEGEVRALCAKTRCICHNSRLMDFECRMFAFQALRPEGVLLYVEGGFYSLYAKRRRICHNSRLMDFECRMFAFQALRPEGVLLYVEGEMRALCAKIRSRNITKCRAYPYMHIRFPQYNPFFPVACPQAKRQTLALSFQHFRELRG